MFQRRPLLPNCRTSSISAPAGTTVQLGAGTFEFDRTVVINRDDIAVVGQGSDTTTINLVGNARAGGAFQIGGVIDQETYSGSFDLTSTATEGSTTLHLADTTGLKAGDVLWVELPNTPEYLELDRRHAVARGQAAPHLDG